MTDFGLDVGTDFLVFMGFYLSFLLILLELLLVQNWLLLALNFWEKW